MKTETAINLLRVWKGENMKHPQREFSYLEIL